MIRSTGVRLSNTINPTGRKKGFPGWRHAGTAVPVVVLALVATLANAACPLDTPHFRVGANATYCTHGTIQAAINAAESTCPTIIEITREHLYGGGFCNASVSDGCSLAVPGKYIVLQGRADGETCYALTQCAANSCAPPAATTPLVTLDGGNKHRVLTITGASTVSLRNLTITHGDAGAGGTGGGIDFSGSGNLNITRSTIATNHAGYGGGVNATGTASLKVRLQADTLVQNNTAEISGGGVRIEGVSRLYALADHTLVTSNHALTDYGGGIEIIGPARADIGSPGFNGAGVISNNDGINGAGIAVIDNGSGGAVLRTFADSASRPTVIENNGGALNGGGIYATGQADICLFASRIAENIAENGAAIWSYCKATNAELCGSVAQGVFINDDGPARLGNQCGPESVAALGGKTECLSGDEQCGAVDNNLTRHLDGSPSAGTTIWSFGYNDPEVIAHRLRMRGNVADEGIRGSVDVTRCLIADNFFSGPILYFVGSTSMLRGCTITHNVIDDAYVLRGANIQIVDTIIDQPGKYPINWLFAPGADISYTMSNSTAGLPQNNPSVVQGTPAFVDAANHDYHLSAVVQTALDFGGPVLEADLDGKSASVDLPGIPNLYGTSDLGAYERQNLFYNCGTSDSLFCSGFQK